MRIKAHRKVQGNKHTARARAIRGSELGYFPAVVGCGAIVVVVVVVRVVVEQALHRVARVHLQTHNHPV